MTKLLRMSAVLTVMALALVSCSDDVDYELFTKYTYLLNNGWQENIKMPINDDNTVTLPVYFGVNGTTGNNKDITVKLGGRGYVFWGGREGYETLLNTDVKFEQENIAKLMHLAVDYGRSIGFTGDFYIEPKPKEPMKHQYDFDAATAIGFLRQYGLDKDFKMNIEANHATLAGHTFQHDLRISAINGMLGSIDANQGDMLLGWDTDEFPFNVYDATMCMYEVLKAGGLTGGFNFDSKTRRPSYTFEDMFHAYILGMDTFALGMIKAGELIEDGRIDKFVEDRYASYKTGIGAKIRAGEVTLKELAAYADEMGAPALPGSGRQEYLESVVNNVLFH